MTARQLHNASPDFLFRDTDVIPTDEQMQLELVGRGDVCGVAFNFAAQNPRKQ